MKANLFFILFFICLNLYAQNNNDDSSAKNLLDTSIATNQYAVKTDSSKVSDEEGKTSDFVEFISNPFTSAALASILTLIITNIYNTRQRKKEERHNYRTTLYTAKNELEFYKQKLVQLDTELANIVTAINSGNKPIIPTYSLYPKFLESSKISLGGFYKNPDIIKRIGHCHYELSHIRERLELIKNELRTNYAPQIQSSNTTGFKNLVSSNIIEFDGMIEDINNELKKIKG